MHFRLLSQDFHNRVSKLGFRVSKTPDRKSKNHFTDNVHKQIK